MDSQSLYKKLTSVSATATITAISGAGAQPTILTVPPNAKFDGQIVLLSGVTLNINGVKVMPAPGSEAVFQVKAGPGAVLTLTGALNGVGYLTGYIHTNF